MGNTSASGSALYISHGGGPLPLLGDAAHAELVAVLTGLAATVKRPAAIVVISAHWEADVPTLTGAAAPPLVYDYYGFPQAAYRIKYPAPGDPGLAGNIAALLDEAGFTTVLDEQRGFDHGLFVPLKIMYPEASVPCVQLSLLSGLDPDAHIRLGRALAGLQRRDVLVLGSGFSFHNMQAFFSAATDDTAAMNRAFEQWLIETCSSPDLGEEERRQRLIDWTRAPAARYCHPREEHLMPLHVCYGFAGSAAGRVFEFEVMGVKASAYLW